jgi:hypothetical protein
MLAAFTAPYFLLFGGNSNNNICGSDGKMLFIAMVGAATSATSVIASSPSSCRVSSSSPSKESKFETYGPTMTITLRDAPTRKYYRSRSQQRVSTALVSKENQMSIDNQLEGLVAKLAERFHISLSSSASTDPSQTSPQFNNGYMLDGGNIVLGPTSESRHDQSAKQFFPLLGGLGPMMHWSDYVKNLQPELSYEIRSRRGDTGDSNNEVDATRPFPGLPWVNAVSCGLKWRPFPIYKPGEGYGHRLLSSPHYVRCGVSIGVPRVSRILTPRKPNIRNHERGTELPKKKSLDLDVTYLDNNNCKGGRMEVLLGKSAPYLKPQSTKQTVGSRRDNHILAYFATDGKQKSSLASSIEYLRGSIHVPLPAFLHKKITKGMSVSPMYDFINKKAGLVISGDGVSGRTSAVLRLDSDDSTLTVVRALDER